MSTSELDALAVAIRRCAGPELLRLKGLLAVAGETRCTVIQAAPGTVHPPALLRAPAPQVGRLVLISDATPSPALLDTLAAFDIVSVARTGF